MRFYTAAREHGQERDDLPLWALRPEVGFGWGLLGFRGSGAHGSLSRRRLSLNEDSLHEEP